MNTNQGIFESLPHQKDSEHQESPFNATGDFAAPVAVTGAENSGSPFMAVGEPDPGAVELPEKPVMDSPFQVVEPPEGFGYEAPASGPSPFMAKAIANDFAAPPTPFFEPSPFASPAVSPMGMAVPAAFALASQPAADALDFLSDSASIRQLELRAIFGVDRELSEGEILQRARALPGIRNLARVGEREMATIEGLKNLLPSLGLSHEPLRLYSGTTPINFIREGKVVLAVQSDGVLGPGVRETLMIVARELGRLG
jgi:hypothetical protein